MPGSMYAASTLPVSGTGHPCGLLKPNQLARHSIPIDHRSSVSPMAPPVSPSDSPHSPVLILIRVSVCLALTALAVAGGPVFAAAAGSDATEPPPPTIVLMIADDQGYDEFGFAGNRAARTPNLDRLAAEGVLFPRAHVAMSRCRPSLVSLLTSLYPHQNGVYYNFGPTGLDPSLDTLPRQLRRSGYLCWAGGKLWERDSRSLGFSHRGADPNSLVRKNQRGVRDFLRAAEGRPVFLWWAPMLPHVPHDPPPRLLAGIDETAIARPAGVPDAVFEAWKRKEQVRLAMGAWLDEGVGELLEILKEHGRLQNTLIVFLADNGFDTKRRAKGTPYERGFRTPVILWDPARIQAGRTEPHLVSALDIAPTLLEWAGAQNIAGAAGTSLWPLVEGRQTQWRDGIFGAAFPERASDAENPRAEADAQALYLRTGQWKYIFYLREIRAGGPGSTFYRFDRATGGEIPAGREELYDLEADPEELENLAERPELRDRLHDMRQQVFAWWTSTGGGPLPLDPADPLSSPRVGLELR